MAFRPGADDIKKFTPSLGIPYLGVKYRTRDVKLIESGPGNKPDIFPTQRHQLVYERV